MTMVEQTRIATREKIVHMLEEGHVRLEFRGSLDANDLEGTFLLQKITHALFPDNTPQPFGFGIEEHGAAYLEVERIIEQNTLDAATFQEQRLALTEKMRLAGLDVDANGDNFIDSKGRVYYIDIPKVLTRKKLTSDTQHIFPMFNAKFLVKAIEAIPNEELRAEMKDEYHKLIGTLPEEIKQSL